MCQKLLAIAFEVEAGDVHAAGNDRFAQFAGELGHAKGAEVRSRKAADADDVRPRKCLNVYLSLRQFVPDLYFMLWRSHACYLG
ncbi:hypothetical protein KJ713_03590 [Patescibacteria group bacterium]|nr:hypothetical protein [Patescibacteria group bacterium]